MLMLRSLMEKQTACAEKLAVKIYLDHNTRKTKQSNRSILFSFDHKSSEVLKGEWILYFTDDLVFCH